MKIIAYSQVPQRNSYVHLAYLSATAQNKGADVLIAGLFVGVFYLYLLSNASKWKLREKSPRLWRRVSIGLITAALLLMGLGCYIMSNSVAYFTLR
jgi:hypothetical protein